jgi:hypothetical protein
MYKFGRYTSELQAIHTLHDEGSTGVRTIHCVGDGGVKEPVDLAHPSLIAMPSTDIIDIRLKHKQYTFPSNSPVAPQVCTAELIFSDSIMANLACAIGGKLQSAEMMRTQKTR